MMEPENQALNLSLLSDIVPQGKMISDAALTIASSFPKRRYVPKRSRWPKTKKIKKLYSGLPKTFKCQTEESGIENQPESNKTEKEGSICTENLEVRKNETNTIEELLKIKFEAGSLPQEFQKLYNVGKKLKNSDLMISGVKFCQDVVYAKIKKWEKAIIIYQVPCSRGKECHFGTLLKYGNDIITFDGIPDLWPKIYVQKSYHWEEQPDSWSCGYVALFWATTIMRVGIEEWVSKYEPSRG